MSRTDVIVALYRLVDSLTKSAHYGQTVAQIQSVGQHSINLLQVMTTAIKLMGRKEAAETAAEFVDTTAQIQKKVDNGPLGTSDVSFKTARTDRTNG